MSFKFTKHSYYIEKRTEMDFGGAITSFNFFAKSMELLFSSEFGFWISKSNSLVSY